MPGRGAAGKSHGKGKKGYYRYSGNKLPARFAASKPIHRRFPKSWKVVNRRKRHFRPLNLGQLQWLIDTGRIDPNKKITLRVLRLAGAFRQNLDRFPHGMKLCAKGKEMLREKLDIEIPMSSYEAAKAVLDLGGKLRLVYYTELGIRTIVKPEKWTERNMPLPRPAEPHAKWAFFYTERDENGLPYRQITSPEEVLFLHPRKVQHLSLFPKSIKDMVAGNTTTKEIEFSERLRRAQEMWSKAREAANASAKEREQE